MTTPVAVLIGSIIIAGTMAFIFRYDIAPASVGVAYKYDRWTGKLQQCKAPKGVMDCRDGPLISEQAPAMKFCAAAREYNR